MTKNELRRSRFQRIGEALTSIYAEAGWRHRKEDHEFGMRPEVVHDKGVTARSAGGPALKTVQFDCNVRGIRGLNLIADNLKELQKVEQRIAGQ